MASPALMALQAKMRKARQNHVSSALNARLGKLDRAGRLARRQMDNM